MNQWLVIAIAALMPMVAGFAWYHKALFGNAWMKSIGKTEDDLQNGNMPVTFGVAYIAAFIVCMILYYFVNSHPDPMAAWMHGAFHGGQMGAMVAVPVLVSNSLFEQKSWTNILINGAYWIVAFILMGAVIGALSLPVS